MTEDMELVGEFVAQQSEQAFATLVSRHLNLVYSAALRQVGDPHLAQEVTQVVFLILARKAGSLGPGTILSGWLYRTAQYASADALKKEFRRKRREQEAHMELSLNSPEPESWTQIAPLLDKAMASLGETDRNAVVLRFFEGKTLQNVGAELGTSEDAAKKRVTRAVEKLRKFFTRRGVVLSATALVATISANSVQAAPVSLLVSIPAAAGQGAVVGTSTLTLIKGTLKLMAWTKLKTTAVVTAAVLLTSGTGIVAVKTIQAVNSARATAAHPIQGVWEGTLEPQPGIKLRLGMKLTQANGAYRATVDSFDQGVKDIPVSKIAYRYPSFGITVESVNGDYKATLNPAGTEITGTWTQMGKSWPLLMKRATEPAGTPQPLAENAYAPRPNSDLQGFWRGSLKVGNTSLRLNLKIAEAADGAFRGEFDSPDQGAKGLPVTALTYTRPAVRFELNGVGGVFEGNVDERNSSITGSWTQMGKKLPLTFQRGEPDTAAAQEADKNFSYTSSDDLPGHWQGTLEVQKMKLRLMMNIARMPDGLFSATMDSLDQGANDIPATAVQFKPPNLHMEWKGIGGTFDGKLADGKLTGTWRQGRGAFPLVLER